MSELIRQIVKFVIKMKNGKFLLKFCSVYNKIHTIDIRSYVG